MAYRGAAALVAVTCLALLASCTSNRPRPELRIGIIGALTGDSAPVGTAGVNAARLAVDEANRRGDLIVAGQRCRVVLVPKDGGTLPELSLAAGEELIRKDEVSALISPALPNGAMLVAQLAEKLRVPVAIRATLGSGATRDMRYAFRLTYDDEAEGTAVARFVREHLSLRTAAMLYDSTNLGNPAVAEAFRKTFVASGGVITATERYAFGQRSFEAQLRTIAASRPACLFLPNYSYDVLAQVRGARALGLSMPIICGGAMSFTSPSNLAQLEGVWMAEHFVPDAASPAVSRFVAAYRGAYGSEPGQSAALGYDACMLIIAAARDSKSVSPEAIAAALRAERTFEGVTGTMRYGDRQGPRMDVPMARVVGGVLRRDQGTP